MLRRPDSADRDAILAATVALVAERGYPSLTVAVICARAGLIERDFHRHFRDAEDAFCTVIEEGTSELLNRALPVFAAQPAWDAGLRAVAYELRDFLLENPCRARVMVIESFRACDRSRRIRERGMSALAAIIDLGRAELPDPDSPPPNTAELTAGAIYNRIHTALEAGETLADERVRELMYIAVRPYLGIDAALAELEAPRP
jgi:AcrR family transcriptional regulator